MDDSFFDCNIAEWLEATDRASPESASPEMHAHACTKLHPPRDYASSSSSSFLRSTGDENLPARFAPPKTDSEIVCARQTAIPAKTVQDTKYCISVFEEWRKYRLTTGADIKELTDMNKPELQYWMV